LNGGKNEEKPYLFLKAYSKGSIEKLGFELKEGRLPLKAIGISIVAVAILIWVIMRFSLKKINKQNIIETIRKDII